MTEEQDILMCLELAFTDKNGNNIYAFKNVAEIPFKRFMSAKVQEHFITMGIDKSILEKIVSAGIRYSQQTITDIEEFKSEINLLFQNIKLRIGYVCSEDLYLRLAACYYVIEGEPLEAFDNNWFEKKRIMCEEDPALKGFFLQTAFRLTTDLPNISENIMQTSLQYAMEREKQIPPSKLMI